jgi:hypothetical protein
MYDVNILSLLRDVLKKEDEDWPNISAISRMSRLSYQLISLSQVENENIVKLFEPIDEPWSVRHQIVSYMTWHSIISRLYQGCSNLTAMILRNIES